MIISVNKINSSSAFDSYTSPSYSAMTSLTTTTLLNDGMQHHHSRSSDVASISIIIILSIVVITALIFVISQLLVKAEAHVNVARLTSTLELGSLQHRETEAETVALGARLTSTWWSKTSAIV